MSTNDRDDAAERFLVRGIKPITRKVYSRDEPLPTLAEAREEFRTREIVHVKADERPD